MDKKKILLCLTALLPLAGIAVALFTGRYDISVSEIVEILLKGYTNLTIKETLVWEIRLPRALLGVIAGAGLAGAGAALQGLFHNPLVDSNLLGVSSGAGFGAALAIVLFNGTAPIYFFSIFFSIVAVVLCGLIAGIYKRTDKVTIVLAGVIIATIFSALISFLKHVADPYDQLPSLIFWLMGSLARADYNSLLFASIPILIGTGGLFAIRWRINIVSLGDRDAAALGINTGLTKSLIILFSTMATAGAVSVCGIIGWIGLIVPHIGRMIFGNDNRVLIPVSIFFGGFFLIFIDSVGRVITGSELPLNILISLIGGPFYIWLLKKTRGGKW